MDARELYSQEDLINKIVSLEKEINDLRNSLISEQNNNIAQRKRLETINLRLKETGEAAKIGQWMYDVNRGMLTYYGEIGGLYSGYQELMISIDEYLKQVHPDDFNKLESYIKGEVVSKEPIEYRLIKNGQVLYFKTKIIRIREISDILALK